MYQHTKRKSFTDMAAQVGSVDPPYVYGDQTVDTLFELVQLNFTDATELEVAGLPALQQPTQPMINDAKGWTRTNLYVFPDDNTMLQMYASTPKGVDSAQAVIALAEIAVPRLALIGTPSPSPSGPAPSGAAPSGEARTGLAALFPSDIGGGPVSIDRALTGPEFLSQIVNFKPMEQRVTKALRQRKRKVNDLSFVIGSSQSGSIIAAFKVDGAKIKPLVQVLMESMAMDRTGQDPRPEDVAGKDVFGILGGFLIGGEGFAYPKDDVLWLVFPTPNEQGEIFEKLP